MRTVDDYAKYRTAHRDGMTIRQIARTFHVSRRTVREALASPEPKPYTRTKPPPAPVLGPFTTIIDQVLHDDRDAPPKQRHTAAQLFRRLQDEHGFPGSYPTVRRYVAAHRRHSAPTFIPLAHPPGSRLEADFGHIHVDFPDGRRLVPFLVTVWAYSNAPFVIALPTERTEAGTRGSRGGRIGSVRTGRFMSRCRTSRGIGTTSVGRCGRWGFAAKTVVGSSGPRRWRLG